MQHYTAEILAVNFDDARDCETLQTSSPVLRHALWKIFSLYLSHFADENYLNCAPSVTLFNLGAYRNLLRGAVKKKRKKERTHGTAW